MEKNQPPTDSLETQTGTNLSIDDIDNLKKLTDTRWIEIASGDIESHIQNDENNLDTIGKKPGTYYRDIIFALLQIPLARRGGDAGLEGGAET